MPKILRALWMFATLLVATNLFAFGLQLDTVDDYFDTAAAAKPRATIPFLDGKYPVHQSITQKTLNCGAAGSPCESIRAKGVNPNYVLKGVRWNDFPAFYLSDNAGNCEDRVLRVTQAKDVHCYILMLTYAYLDKDRYRRDTHWAIRQPIGARGHFGDLQFWHAMAQANQSAGETYDNIQMWMEFEFRVSLGEFDLKSDIAQLPVPGLKKFFLPGARKTGDLLDYRFDQAMAQGIALGVMLHIVQDSFAKCHAQRDDEGRLVRFYNYSGQNSKMHSYYDTDDKEVQLATGRRLNPYDFGERLLRLRGESTTWEEAKPKLRALVEEYFRPANPYLLSRNGDGCARS
ncbi:hypothetical protein HU735_03575 [Pseudomonas sp. BW16M2]|uniref:hypothetical protein n=1 Tax=Pseudomonas sp. BW16M2 TaxID=2745489 RepID=UPI001646C13C|nr:hypothetical protein [Pseudomonas sp. BW16M2]MBC3434483.1 hypothetical protein [Pseudomonas sp. BW16M2]